MRKTIPFAVMVSLLVLTGPEILAAQKGDAKAGKKTYDSLCATCHGSTGKGDGPGAAVLNPKPRDHTDCKTMAKESDATLVKVIKEGGQSVGRSPLMPPWGGALKDQQIRELVAYIRGFCKK